MTVGSRSDFIELLDNSFSSISSDDDHNHTNLKSYLIESNLPEPPKITNFDNWKSIGHKWYISQNNKNQFFIADCSDERIWILYTISHVSDMDLAIKQWISDNIGLDRCWLTKNNFHALEDLFNFQERGVGLKFKDKISDFEDPFGFSLKAWYGSGANEKVDRLFNALKEEFTTTSVRWRKLSDGHTSLRLECYNNGKITINYLEDVEETLSSISQISELYKKALLDGEKARQTSRSAFEFTFTQDVNLDDYSTALSKGNNKLKLWMYEYESGQDYRRFTGVDLHNLDQILLDMGNKYAFMSIPGDGCVNAAPRFATIQGQYACGDVKIMFEGSDIFDFKQV